jgi:diaminohydroxyphosphoribosylaminopyrimidine deaminase/5-amino-6-(5-phosphoribosylamino)uracil reductase
MAQALALGATAEGSTSPNPRVGCLLVQGGEVVGRGCHRAPGRPHAEALAVADAGGLARGATLYVNLEPCAHHGRTPPCADMLLRAGVRRVVVAVQDPDPRVNGRGLDALRRAGVQVELGLMAPEAGRLNEPFLRWHREGLPLVTLKAAATLDGMLSARSGESRWVTAAPARRFAHRLRWRHDAVLVGAGTVRRDDPRLTVRLDGPRAARRRVVLTSSLDLDPGAELFSGAGSGPPVLVYTSNPRAEAADPLRGRADVRRLAGRDGALEIEAVLRDLAGEGVQSVLVEGGARTFASFLEAGLAHRAAIFVSGKLLGARGGTPLVDRATVESPGAGWRLEREALVALGPDLLWTGRVRPGRSEGA